MFLNSEKQWSPEPRPFRKKQAISVRVTASFNGLWVEFWLFVAECQTAIRDLFQLFCEIPANLKLWSLATCIEKAKVFFVSWTSVKQNPAEFCKVNASKRSAKFENGFVMIFDTSKTEPQKEPSLLLFLPNRAEYWVIVTLRGNQLVTVPAEKHAHLRWWIDNA